MNRQDFSNLGENIKNLVQDAIDSQNFDQLSRTINQTIHQTLDGVGETLNHTVNHVGKNINDTLDQVGQTLRGERGYFRTSSYSQHRTHQNPYVHPKRQTARRQEPFVTDSYFPSNLVRNCTPMNIGGTFLAAVGTPFAGIFGISMMIVAFAEHRFFLPSAILSVFFAGSLYAAFVGFRMRGRYQRFQTYLRHMGGKTYASIQDLADAVGRSKRYVVRDLKNMIRKRMFLEGHIDQQKTCLMISNESYQQYQQALANAKMQQQFHQQQAEKSSSGKKEEYSEEVRKIIEEGNSYIEKIKHCNDQISDTEFSAKLSRLEMIVTKIFNRVKEKPDLAPDLRKFMEYYLPTTWKLIDAYRVLDQQSIQGENISSSKKEIRDTLDTINEAFENLLDRFFQDTAWDISTDISALQMMLAQEGLTDQGFPGSKKNK